jgi:hypothetical protein
MNLIVFFELWLGHPQRYVSNSCCERFLFFFSGAIYSFIIAALDAATGSHAVIYKKVNKQQGRKTRIQISYRQGFL